MTDLNGSSNQTLEVSESADELTIINRSKTYHVSKKFICSSIPYFEKMFCCDLLEAKENTVQLDLDEHSFTCILNWIQSDSLQIKMENIIALFDVADYLMLNDLSNDCYSYFHANFTIEHLPIIIPQVTKTSKLINSGALNTFICRHFLKIVKTSKFLNFPVETVEYICKLDLMISSEYQVLEAINDWIKVKADDRKKYLLRLLKCIRWCYAETDISSKIMEVPYIATIQDIKEILCSPGNCKLKCTSKRSDQCLLVSIQKIDDMVLSLRVLQSQSWLPVGIFNLDDSMSLELVHGENISDVLYDCGTKGVRIDWESKKFCWLNFESDKSYYLQINKLIVCSQIASSKICYVENSREEFADPFIELFRLHSLPKNNPTLFPNRGSRDRDDAAPGREQPNREEPAGEQPGRDDLEIVWGDEPRNNRRMGFAERASYFSNLAWDLFDPNNARRIESINFSAGQFYPTIRFNRRSSTRQVTASVTAKDDGRLLLESEGKYIVVGKSNVEKFYALFPVRNHEWFKVKNYVNYDERSFIATVLGPNIFILTTKLKFIQFNYKTQAFKKTAPFKGSELKFLDLIITSRQDNDNKIVLIDKSCGKIHIFNIDSQTWTETSISNRAPKQNDPKDCIMTATSVFLPLNKTKNYFRRNIVY
ncbi:uncharacterized protein LOC107361473 [Tetranychus urticae]|uniref:uncharacterized protein LOC107361473 n=1 Tax=Tetranychus urticae TaxID=32264 RepID=UPI00077B9759|nr:uncharacterized protein LOC107361473 [Tetranychus urticae]